MTLLNELSLIGQAQSIGDASALIKSCAELLQRSRRRDQNSVIASHSTLYQRRLISSIPLLELLFVLRDIDRDSALVFLKLTKYGPFTDIGDQQHEIPCTCYFEKRPRTAHPIALAAHGRGRLVSLPRSGAASQHRVRVLLCKNHHRAIAVDNFVDLADIPHFRWNYAPSRKHSRGGWGTLMDLDDKTAQLVLDSGVKEGRLIYAFHAETFYKFHPDNFEGYHGYPVERVHVPAQVASQLTETIRSKLD